MDFLRDVLDRHRKARGIGFDLDTVYVARHGRISPNFQPGLIWTYPGKRQRDSDIQIRRKSFCCFPRRTLEYPERFGNAFDVDAPFNDIRRAGEPKDRLSRHHPDRLDSSDRRGGHGVQANQRAGRYHDLTAIVFCKLDKVLVVEQGARAENERGLSAFNERSNDRPHELARRAFDDNVSGV